MRDQYLAHSANEADKVELVWEHLKAVAERAAEFASAFGASAEAALAGLLHDLGKYGHLFQRRLAGKERGIDHWSAGAWAALDQYRNKGIAAALAIQGHHVGLQQASKGSLSLLNPDKLVESHPLGLRLSERDQEILLDRLRKDGLRLPDCQEMDDSLYGGLQYPPVASMLDVRMLYSALVDADFIESEAHFKAGPDGRKGYREVGLKLEPERAWGVLSCYLESLAEKSKASPDVNRMRADLLSACTDAAGESPGLFTLTAPTGSGKTLSLLAFALKHAAEHHLRRVVVVIPYLSIIEQTVQEYHKAFESFHEKATLGRYILEHHSLARAEHGATDGAHENSDMENKTVRTIRLLAENWDAPIVVTTSVQFLESLFASRPAACRKLHRLAESVILFDEVQTLRVSLAVPTLAALSRLAERFRATVVFSTATQPAFSHLDESVKEYCPVGWTPREMAPRSLNLFARARRTRIEWPNDSGQSTSWVDLAGRLEGEDQALCIVNLKRHALALHSELRQRRADGLFHISTNMCPAHRRDVLDEVRTRLAEALPCRVVSTQCVEAGVDVDFPILFRAWGPLDAIAQAAGRCNRNGKAEIGRVRVFFPEEEKYPDPAYRQAAGVTRILLKTSHSGELNIHSPETFERYYRDLYNLVDPKNRNEDLLKAIKIQDFAQVARLYRVILKDAINVLVPYDTERFRELEEEVYETGLTGKWIARARPYAIGVFRPAADDPITRHLIPVPVGRRSSSEEWFIYSNPEHYSLETGLVPPESMDCLIA